MTRAFLFGCVLGVCVLAGYVCTRKPKRGLKGQPAPLTEAEFQSREATPAIDDLREHLRDRGMLP